MRKIKIVRNVFGKKYYYNILKIRFRTVENNCSRNYLFMRME